MPTPYNRMSATQRVRVDVSQLGPLERPPPNQLRMHPLNQAELREAVLLCIVNGRPEFAHQMYDHSERRVISLAILEMSNYFSGHVNSMGQYVSTAPRARDAVLARELDYLSRMIRDERDRDPALRPFVDPNPADRSARVGRAFGRDGLALNALKHIINREFSIAQEDIEISDATRALIAQGRLKRKRAGTRRR